MCLPQASLVLGSGTYLTISGGTGATPVYVHVTDGSSSAISGSGSIVSEGEYNLLRWDVADNVGTYTVPLATGATHTYSAIPLTFQITTAGSIDGYIDFATYGTSSNNQPLPDSVLNLNHVTPVAADGSRVYDRFWFVNAESYTTKPEGSLSFGYIAGEMTGNLTYGTSVLVAQQYSTADTNWLRPALGIDNGTNAVSSVSVTAARFHPYWTLVDVANLLPVTLLDFDAIWGDESQRYAIVTWQTAIENNNDYFEVQRSSTGYNWTSIATVAGAGNSVEMIDYEWYDYAPLDEVSYYRLKQVDFNGQYTYSEVVSLSKSRIHPQQVELQLYPNPANDRLQVRITGSASHDWQLMLYTITGEVVTWGNASSAMLQQGITISTAHLSAGSYLLIARSADTILREKVIVTH